MEYDGKLGDADIHGVSSKEVIKNGAFKGDYDTPTEDPIASPSGTRVTARAATLQRPISGQHIQLNKLAGLDVECYCTDAEDLLIQRDLSYELIQQFINQIREKLIVIKKRCSKRMLTKNSKQAIKEFQKIEQALDSVGNARSTNEMDNLLNEILVPVSSSKNPDGNEWNGIDQSFDISQKKPQSMFDLVAPGAEVWFQNSDLLLKNLDKDMSPEALATCVDHNPTNNGGGKPQAREACLQHEVQNLINSGKTKEQSSGKLLSRVGCTINFLTIYSRPKYDAGSF